MSRRIFVDKKMNKEDMEPLPADGGQDAGAESQETSGESITDSAKPMKARCAGERDFAGRV